jgi:ABC-2 type transport system permease protein
MNRKMIWAIAKKDMRAVFRSGKVWIGLVLLPLLMGVAIPGAAVAVLRFSELGSADMQELLGLLDAIPALQDSTAYPTDNHKLIYLFVNYMLGPLFLLIPVINAMMIAVNSFVGEKERRTLESLLLAPIEVRDLFAGKLLASFIPSFAATVASFVLCGIVVDSLAYGLFGGLIFPSWTWVVMLLWVTPAFTLLAILFSVFVSARSKGFQEAQQVAGVVVLPIVGLLISQATGLLILSAPVLLIIGGVLLLVDLVLLRFIAGMNRRDVLFERQVH